MTLQPASRDRRLGTRPLVASLLRDDALSVFYTVHGKDNVAISCVISLNTSHLM